MFTGDECGLVAVDTPLLQAGATLFLPLQKAVQVYTNNNQT